MIDIEKLRTETRFMTAKDLAPIFGVKPRTILMWAYRGKLPPMEKLVTFYGYYPETLRKFLKIKGAKE